MKKVISIITMFAVIITGTFFSACQSSAKKVDEAKVKVEDAQQDLTNAKKAQNEEAIKAANNAEWQIFKTESEAKIKENNTLIADFKAKRKTAGKTLDAIYAKDIAALQEKNSDLQGKIDNYDKNRSDWESFKREFNHDMAGFGQAFKDLTVNNHK